MKKLIEKLKDLWNKIFNKNKDKQNNGNGNNNGNGGSNSNPVKPAKLPAIGSGTQYWYGRVNFWAKDKNLLKKEVELMASVGVTGYIIEMAGWRSSAGDISSKPGSDAYKKFISGCESTYKYLHSLCKKYGLWLFCCIVNDNALENKHGNKAIDAKHYYGNVASDLLKIVLADGKDNVVVQPISELHPERVKSHPGPAWQKNAISKLKSAGFKTCNNDGYGRPSGYAGCDYKAWHPNNVGSLPGGNTAKNKTFIISDTGGIISELNGGTNCDKEDADCKPSKIKEWRQKCKGFAVCGYYDFRRKSFNEAAIKAMGGK